MNRLLIISPYFPPVNTADMQRIRMSLPYFKQYGWDAEVVTVDSSWSDLAKDDLLLENIPSDIKIHKVNALNKKWTSKLGFGNIAFRSYWFYRSKVNELLKNKKFDLIYFSTTQFPICVLGAYWKKRFGVPYVIDMQDPWHSNYYRDKPKHQQPPKYWLSYSLNKYLEPKALKYADGLISVSEDYITALKNRYSEIKTIPADTITFGYFISDMDIAIKNKNRFAKLLNLTTTNIVCVGRGGIDMHSAITPVLKVLKQGLSEQPKVFKQLKLYFIGTSYAPKGEGVPTILPLAKQHGVEDYVVEIVERISYFHTLITLQDADALFIPGSDDPRYTASKIYPYLFAKKPLLAIFSSISPALKVLHECGVKNAHAINDQNTEANVFSFLKDLINGNIDIPYPNQECVEKYSAQNMTKRQCDLFNRVLNKA